MKLETRIFDICNKEGINIAELAETMGISTSHIESIRSGELEINVDFIVGSIKAFPEYKIGDLFYFKAK